MYYEKYVTELGGERSWISMDGRVSTKGTELGGAKGGMS